MDYLHGYGKTNLNVFNETNIDTILLQSVNYNHHLVLKFYLLIQSYVVQCKISFIKASHYKRFKICRNKKDLFVTGFSEKSR